VPLKLRGASGFVWTKFDLSLSAYLLSRPNLQLQYRENLKNTYNCGAVRDFFFAVTILLYGIKSAVSYNSHQRLHQRTSIAPVV
jgi:hypothetical protein